ncbi:hypothetical protein NCCP2495_22340 [Dietzia sp. NCCP-2495]|nr:hypothetical protein NCCP2495_22340 [Dietzia sp. NCCP-2495]
MGVRHYSRKRSESGGLGANDRLATRGKRSSTADPGTAGRHFARSLAATAQSALNRAAHLPALPNATQIYTANRPREAAGAIHDSIKTSRTA